MSLSVSRSIVPPVTPRTPATAVSRPGPAAAPAAAASAAPRSVTVPATSAPAAATAPPTPLDLYKSQPPARTDQVPSLLVGLKYGSRPPEQAGLITQGVVSPHVEGIVPMSVEVTKIAGAGIGNVFNPEWVGVVKEAVERNGGLGDGTSGFLAYSQQHGFVRFLNPNLTPEQNRRLAEISLVMGAPIEKMPSRSTESAIEKPKIDGWVNEFIGRYDKELADFQADPTNGMSVKEGRTRYKLEVNQAAGRVVSYNMKKAGPFRSFMAKAMKFIGPLADIATFIPGIGTAAAVGLQLLKTTGQMVVSGGKFVASSIAGLVGSVLHLDPGLLGIGKLTAGQMALAQGGLSAGGQLIDTGKVNPQTLLNTAVGGLINGLPGGPAMDHVVQQSVLATAHAIQTGQLSAADILPILYDVLGQKMTGRPADTRVESALRLMATGVQNGKITLADLVPLSQAILTNAGASQAEKATFDQAFRAIVDGLRNRQITPNGLMNSQAAASIREAADRRAA